VNLKNSRGSTALMFVSMSNPNPAAIESLVNAGADVNARDTEGMSALMMAKRENPHPDVIRALISAGASDSGD